MAQRDVDKPSTIAGHDEGPEGLDRRPDLSELFEGEVMGSGRRVVQEGQVRGRLSRAERPTENDGVEPV
jgi:hypothetical protein